MDVDKELDKALRIHQSRINRRFVEAETRLMGVTTTSRALVGWEALGAAYREMHDQLMSALNAFAKGWNSK